MNINNYYFSGKLGVHGSRNEGRRVLFYSAYAVLAPVILILITFLINQYGDSTKDYHPGIGGGQCFLKSKLTFISDIISIYLFIKISASLIIWIQFQRNGRIYITSICQWEYC